MNYESLTIGIKDCTVEKVKSALNLLIPSETLLQLKNNFSINIDISDYSELYLYTSNFLAERNLEDDTPFFNYFDITPYSVQIDFDVSPNFKYLSFLEPIVFILGQHISSELKTSCIVMFDNMRLPIGLLQEGILIETFSNYNKNFFSTRLWQPNGK